MSPDKPQLSPNHPAVRSLRLDGQPNSPARIPVAALVARLITRGHGRRGR